MSASWWVAAVFAVGVSVASASFAGVDAGRAHQDDETASHVVVTCTASSLVLGIDTTIEVRAHVDGGPSPTVPLRFFSNVGRFDEVIRLDERTAVASFVVPAERYPQVAILAVEAQVDGVPLRGATLLRLRAAASPAFRTQPGASVTLQVGDKAFGPERAGADGLVRIAVVVPPGVAYALARSVARDGASTEQQVDLRVPPFPRTLVLAPATLVAGTAADVTVFGVEPGGEATPSAGLDLRVTRGTGVRIQKADAAAHAPETGDVGRADFRVRVPGTLPAERLVELTGTAAGPDAGTGSTREVALAPAPAAQLHVTAAPLGAHGRAVEVVLQATDRFGNAAELSDARLAGTYERGRAGDEIKPGRVRWLVPAFADTPGGPAWVVRLGGLTAAVPAPPVLAPPVPPLRPALALAARTGGWLDLRHPALRGPAVFVEATAGPSRGQSPVSAGVRIGYLLRAHELETGGARGDGLDGAARLRLHVWPVLLVARWRLVARRGFEAAVGAGAGVAWARAALTVLGATVSAHDVAPAAEGSGELAWHLRTHQLLLRAAYLWTELGDLSSGDTVRGNAAGLLLDAGYRHSW